MQNAETVLSVLRDRWRAVMRGNSHVRFGPEAVGKGSAPQTPRQRPTGTKDRSASDPPLVKVRATMIGAWRQKS